MEETTPVKKDNKKLVLAAMIVFFIIAVLVLYVIKINSTNFKWAYFFIWTAGLLIIFGGGIIGFYVFNRGKKEIEEDVKEKYLKQAAPITIGECENLVRKIMEDPLYCQYLGTPINAGVVDKGKILKSSIYIFEAYGKYLLKGERIKYSILINMHSPDIKRRVLTNATPYEVNKAAELLATNPDNEPDVREIINENILTGNKQTIREQIKTLEKEEKKEENKKEDLQ